MENIKQIELLSPAKNAEYGIAAINCGADAVYIGATKFGARAAVGNSIEEISRLINYAHKFSVRVYSTINTILYDNEINEAPPQTNHNISFQISNIIYSHKDSKAQRKFLLEYSFVSLCLGGKNILP